MAGGLNVNSGSGLGGLFYGTPGYNSAPVDQGTQGLIQQQGQQAQNGVSQYVNADLAGTNQHIDTTGVQNRTSALGGAFDPNMQAALQARSQRSMDMGLNQLQAQAQIAGVNQQSQQAQNAFGYVANQQQAMNAANQAQIQAYQNNQAQRSSIISSIFGPGQQLANAIGGMVGGGSAGGNITMPNGSVAGPSNNFGAGTLSQPTMGSQYSGGSPTLAGTSTAGPAGAPSLGNFDFGGPGL